MRIGAIIQARNSSSRLPKKVLKELPYNSGITVLQHVIRRVLKTPSLDTVIVATTDSKNDDIIVDISKEERVESFCGSENDVLDRYYRTAIKFGLDIIVRLTSDCPCIDWNIIDKVIKEVYEKGNDFAHTTQSYPRGVADFEVMTFQALEKAHSNASELHEREHVCPYIYKSHPEKFKIVLIGAGKELYNPEIRLTLDTKDDYTILCAVFDYLYHENNFFATRDIINLFRNKPWLRFINAKIVQKKITDLKGEIEQALNVLELQDLNKAKDYLKCLWNVKK